MDSSTFTKAYAFPHSLRTFRASRVELSPDIYAVWLSQLNSLKILWITDPLWAGADFTSLINAFEKFGPHLEILVIEEFCMTIGFPEEDYFSWATATTEMVKRCSNLTILELKGVCYRANIVRDLPKTLRSLIMDQMHFGGGSYETLSNVGFVDGLKRLPNLKTLDINHNYILHNNVETGLFFKERGVPWVAFRCWCQIDEDDESE